MKLEANPHKDYGTAKELSEVAEGVDFNWEVLLDNLSGDE